MCIHTSSSHCYCGTQVFASSVNSQVYTSSSHCYCHFLLNVLQHVCSLYFSFAHCAELYARGSRFINILLWWLLLWHFTAYRLVPEALQTLWETLWDRVSKVLLQMLPPTCPAMTPGSSVWPACPPRRTAPWWSVACAAAPHAVCWLGSGHSPPVAAVFPPPGCGPCSPPAVPWTAGSPCPGCSAETVSNQKGTSNALDLVWSLFYMCLKLKVKCFTA